jgi:hypothetical protein
MSNVKNFVFRGGKQYGTKDIEAFHEENLRLKDKLNRMDSSGKDQSNRISRLEKDNYELMAYYMKLILKN